MFKVENLFLYTLNKKEKSYLLKDISFSLNQADSLGIIGKSGEGKSTLAKALLKIYDKNVFCESGSITLANEDIKESDRGKYISIVFQNPNSYLNPLMKVGEQIDEMLIYHFKENKKLAKVKAIKFMEELGIKNANQAYDKYPHEISGGMQQRICLAIALICHPKVVILDESTSYLDNASKVEILQIIKKMQEKYKFTLIMISHDFKEIYSMCDKIAIMHKGTIVEFGNKDEVVLNACHPYSFELLLDYLRYHENIDLEVYDYPHLENSNSFQALNISPSHYARITQKTALPNIAKTIKEKVYEIIRN